MGVDCGGIEGGKNVGAETGLAGAGAADGCEAGGRSGLGEVEVGLPAGNGTVAGRDGGGAAGRLVTPFDGGRAGKLIRTVSRGLAAGVELGEGRGGSVIRTVSFLGSLGSAMGRRRLNPQGCRKIRNLSLANFTSQGGKLPSWAVVAGVPPASRQDTQPRTAASTESG